MSPSEQPAEPSRAPRRCLVVDDSADMRAIVARMLARRFPSAMIEVAADAPSALELLDGEGDGRDLLVISDYDMGAGPTGTQLLAEVAVRCPRATRLLFTGHAPERVLGRGEPPHAILSKDDGMIALTRIFDTFQQAAARMDAHLAQ